MPEIWEIERETDEQQEHVQDMALEIEDHRERARQLAEVVADLKAAQGAVGSDGLRTALVDAEAAERAAQERLEDLREQRDAMLRENEQMQARVDETNRRKIEALHKIPLLQKAMRSNDPEANPAGRFYERMEVELNEDVRRSDDASADLEDVRAKLQALDL